MTTYHKDQLPPDLVKPAERLCKRLLKQTGAQYLVWYFYKAPGVLQDLCCYNGGDEDWMVVASQEKCIPYQYPSWLDYTDSCYEPDEYQLDGVTIYVGSHA